MAWEQNPYTVKVSLTADSSLSPTTNSAGTVVFTPQFRFVALGSNNVALTGLTATAGNATLSGNTATPAGFVGIVPGAQVNTLANAAATAGLGTTGAYVTSVNIAAGTLTLSAPAVGSTTNMAVTFTSQGQPATQPVATAIVAGTTSAGTTATLAQKAFGILQNTPSYRTAANGNVENFVEGEITIAGISKVVCGAAVSVGQALTIDTTGAVLPAVYNTTGASGAAYAAALPTQWVYGTALSSGAAGDLIAMAVSSIAPARNA
jgi:hypothetical protein